MSAKGHLVFIAMANTTASLEYIGKQPYWIPRFTGRITDPEVQLG